MDLGFKGKVALVSGTGSQIGFGREVALLLAREGCDAVACTDVDIEGAEKTAQAIRKLGRKSIAVKADITSSGEVRKMVEKVAGEYGKIDILVNVAGGIIGRGPLEEQDVETWEKNIRLNLYGTMLVTQAVLPIMKQHKYGSIINIGSGSTHMYGHGVNAYAIAKIGVDLFTKQLALTEVKTGIRVNCVAPGPSPTNFIKGPEDQKQAIMAMQVQTVPMGKITTPQDIAYAAAFFASDISGDITGQVLHVSGGAVM
jgi:NAD(P)-dependent dehydrogenase (short-subunit alcohol dehydrogenase family)